MPLTVITQSNEQVYFAGNIGIGTTVPQASLHTTQNIYSTSSWNQRSNLLTSQLYDHTTSNIDYDAYFSYSLTVESTYSPNISIYTAYADTYTSLTNERVSKVSSITDTYFVAQMFYNQSAAATPLTVSITPITVPAGRYSVYVNGACYSASVGGKIMSIAYGISTGAYTSIGQQNIQISVVNSHTYMPITFTFDLPTQVVITSWRITMSGTLLINAEDKWNLCMIGVPAYYSLDILYTP